MTIPFVVVALCQCPKWAIDRSSRDSEGIFIKNQSEHLLPSWTAHRCTASFATRISVHPIGCRDAVGMTRPSGWMPVRPSAATARPHGRWTEAVCHPKIARECGHELGRSVVNNPAMTSASATTADGWRGSWISILSSDNIFRTFMDSNSRGCGDINISTLQRSHGDGGFG